MLPVPWSFDIRSGLLVGALLTLLIGVVLAVVARAMPAAFRPAMNWWVAATLLQPAGFVLLSQRDQLPAWHRVMPSGSNTSRRSNASYGAPPAAAATCPATTYSRLS